METIAATAALAAGSAIERSGAASSLGGRYGKKIRGHDHAGVPAVATANCHRALHAQKHWMTGKLGSALRESRN